MGFSMMGVKEEFTQKRGQGPIISAINSTQISNANDLLNIHFYIL